ncbi:hypothetical protein D3C73_1211900 [compost metagenome]
MVKRGDTGGGEAQQEAVESEVVEAPSPQGELIIGVIAALAMAPVQVFESCDVGRGLQRSGRLFLPGRIRR